MYSALQPDTLPCALIRVLLHARTTRPCFACLCPANTPHSALHFIGKQVVEPKIGKLRESEAELKVATRERQAVEEELAVVQARLDEMQAQFDAAMAQKQASKAVLSECGSDVERGDWLAGGRWQVTPATRRPTALPPLNRVQDDGGHELPAGGPPQTGFSAQLPAYRSPFAAPLPLPWLPIPPRPRPAGPGGGCGCHPAPHGCCKCTHHCPG